MTAAQNAYVVVGGGLAGAKAAETLRAEGYDGPLVVVGAEPEVPYERPPLSKAYLAGTAARDSMQVHPSKWYDENDVDLRTGVRARALDLAGHRVELDTGEQLTFAKLLLATGSAARHLPLAGADLPEVHHLRTVADADRLREALSGGGRRVVGVGAGWIGLEVAAAARNYGNDVTIVEPERTPLNRALGADIGEVFARLHRDNGVDLRTGTSVSEIRDSGGHVGVVVTDRGDELPTDLVVVGIGAAPDVALAADAGLEVAGGVVVDAALRSSHPDVYAAGDIAEAFHPHFGRSVRVEHWANALNGGPAAARAMLGQPVSYDRLPYFFTDQYDLGMEYSGLAGPDATVVLRGRPEDGAFLAFWLTDGRVDAAMNVNIWDVTDDLQALIRSRAKVDPAQLADPDVALADLATSG